MRLEWFKAWTKILKRDGGERVEFRDVAGRAMVGLSHSPCVVGAGEKGVEQDPPGMQ